MIIFYDKKTREIIGTVDGRVHTPQHLKMWIGNPETTGKYVVPFEPNVVEEKVPIKEMRVVDKKTMRVDKVVIGYKKVKRSRGLFPKVSFASLILDFETGKKRIYDYKLNLKNGEVVGFKKK